MKPKRSSEVAAANNPQENRFQAEGGATAVGVHDTLFEEHVPETVKKALHHGSVVIAAITSCTNTSNPSVMLAAGLVAKKAVERGLEVPAWVKTSLAPGSKVVRDYLEKAGLHSYMEKIKFHIVGYGCTTCIGNSATATNWEFRKASTRKIWSLPLVLSGKIETSKASIDSEVRANYLMSPPLVVAFALAGRIDLDLR